MKIEYRGRNINEGRDYREAYITYDEQKEREKAGAIFEALVKKGWQVEAEQDCASIPVSDKNEYLELLWDFKEAKKEGKTCCEKYDHKTCKGKFWCGICPLHKPGYKQTQNEAFAMKLQQTYYQREQYYLCSGNRDKAMSYCSCIQIMEKMLREFDAQGIEACLDFEL